MKRAAPLLVILAVACSAASSDDQASRDGVSSGGAAGTSSGHGATAAGATAGSGAGQGGGWSAGHGAAAGNAGHAGSGGGPSAGTGGSTAGSGGTASAAGGGTGAGGAAGKGGAAAGSAGKASGAGSSGTSGAGGSAAKAGAAGASAAAGVSGQAGSGGAGSGAAGGTGGKGGGAGAAAGAGQGGAGSGGQPQGGASGKGGGSGSAGHGGTPLGCWKGGPAAFPGAEGFGACATGGRGGKVIYVTTLSLNGPGSLQEALDAKGKRTILFKVSGLIDGVPIATTGDFTLAGQSSPGGITMRGLLLQGDVVCEAPSAPACPNPSRHPENFVVRHVRLRPGTLGDPDGGGDGLRLHHAKNGVIDHVSIGNAEDEAVQISFTSDVTIQRTLLAETIGGHYEYGGMLLNYSDPARGFPLTRLSIHHNMWNRLFGRMPEVSRENVPDAELMDLEVSNNVLWAHERPMYVAAHNPLASPPPPLHYRLNHVGNYSAQRPIAQCYGLVGVEGGPDPSRPSFTSKSSIFFADDHMNRTTRTDYELIFNNNDFCDAAQSGGLYYGNTPSTRPAVARDARHDFPPISYSPGDASLVAEAVATVGALPRDPMDQRLMASPASGTFASAPLWTNPAGDTLALPFSSPPQAPSDADGDGIPDAWEAANGLDPSLASDGAGTSLSSSLLGVDGYTNLEVYLELLARSL